MKYFLFIFSILFLYSCGGTGSNAPAVGAPSSNADLTGFTEVAMQGSNAMYNEKKNGAGGMSESGYTVNGKKNGPWIKYHEDNGRIMSMESWVDGQLNGPSLNFNNRGQIESKSEYKGGQFDGVVETYKFGRTEKSTPYVNGKIQGMYQEFNQKGKLLKEVEFKNGVQDGTMKYYDDEGNITVEYIYKNGEKVSGGIIQK